MEAKELIDTIVECAKAVRAQLTYGFEEKIYKNAMYIEMKKRGLSIEVEKPIQVYYDGICVGEYRADIVVEEKVIVELKAVNALAVAHSVQLVNYLTATGIDYGILMNFGSEKLEIRTKTRLYSRPIA